MADFFPVTNNGYIRLNNRIVAFAIRVKKPHVKGSGENLAWLSGGSLRFVLTIP